MRELRRLGAGGFRGLDVEGQVGAGDPVLRARLERVLRGEDHLAVGGGPVAGHGRAGGDLARGALGDDDAQSLGGGDAGDDDLAVGDAGGRGREERGGEEEEREGAEHGSHSQDKGEPTGVSRRLTTRKWQTLFATRKP